MIYMKHPTLGNAHPPAQEQGEREAAGWIRWPHGGDTVPFCRGDTPKAQGNHAVFDMSAADAGACVRALDDIAYANQQAEEPRVKRKYTRKV